MKSGGVTLSPLDLMIASHAQAVNAILVMDDKAFNMISGGLTIENWTTP